MSSSDQPRARLSYGFSIVGVQKSGTTTLARAVNHHRQVCRAPRKEMQFFTDEKYDWSNPDYEKDYSVTRRGPRQKTVGDSTPAYIMWPGALERMRDYNPDMRLVALFRDPVERLFSHWAMVRHQNLRLPDWPQFLQTFRTETLPLELPEGVRPHRYRRLAGIPRGYYGAQLRHGFTVFPREQWLLMEFREMLSDFPTALDRTTDHLGLTRFEEHPELENAYPGADKVFGSTPTAEEVADLAQLYAADLAEFQELSGLDVGHWPTVKILAGTMDPAELAAKFARRVTSAPPVTDE